MAGGQLAAVIPWPVNLSVSFFYLNRVFLVHKRFPTGCIKGDEPRYNDNVYTITDPLAPGQISRLLLLLQLSP